MGKYCVTMRDETEWVELVENGFNVLAGSDTTKIVESFQLLSKKDGEGFEKRLYGEGTAGEMVMSELLR